MTTIRHRLDARCPPERLWALLSDLEAVAAYNPGVRTARVVGSVRHGVGATRECELVPRGAVRERVTVWEEGRAVGLELVASDWPIRFMRWVTRIEDGRDGVRIVQDLEYLPKAGPVGWLLDRVLMRRKIGDAVGAALAGLIRKAETPT